MGITREIFLLLLCDAAKHMLKAGDTLEIMYPRLLHVTCTAHLLHNCAEHIRAHFKTTDNLISSIEAATIKKQRPPFFIYCNRFVSSTATNFDSMGHMAGGILFLCGKLSDCQADSQQF